MDMRGPVCVGVFQIFFKNWTKKENEKPFSLSVLEQMSPLGQNCRLFLALWRRLVLTNMNAYKEGTNSDRSATELSIHHLITKQAQAGSHGVAAATFEINLSTPMQLQPQEPPISLTDSCFFQSLYR